MIPGAAQSRPLLECEIRLICLAGLLIYLCLHAYLRVCRGLVWGTKHAHVLHFLSSVTAWSKYIYIYIFMHESVCITNEIWKGKTAAFSVRKQLYWNDCSKPPTRFSFKPWECVSSVSWIFLLYYDPLNISLGLRAMMAFKRKSSYTYSNIYSSTLACPKLLLIWLNDP